MVKRTWSVLLLILVAGLLVACDRDKKDEDDTPPDAQALLSKAAESINTAESFRLELRQEGVPTLIETTLLENIVITFTSAQAYFVQPDRVQAVVTVAFGDAAQEVELVVVQDRQYLKHGLLTQGEWSQQDIAPGFQPADLQSPEKGIGGALLAIQNLEYVDEEELDGVPVYHLRGVVAAERVRSVTVGLMASQAGNVDIDVYVRRDDTGRVAKIVLKEPATEPDTFTTWSISFDSYNQEFEIEEPQIAEAATP